MSSLFGSTMPSLARRAAARFLSALHLRSPKPPSERDRMLAAFWREYDRDLAQPVLEQPAFAAIEVTNSCNLNCVMCNTKMSKRPAGFITPPIFEKVLQELCSVGIRNVSLHTVGETFLHPHLDELLPLLEQYEFSFWISTNAQFPDRIARLHERFPKSFNRCRFSIDGATKETYEAIRLGAKYEKMIESCETVHRINSATPDIPIDLRIDVVLSLSNMQEIPTFFTTFGKYCSPDKIGFGLINALSPDQSFFKESFPFPNLIGQYKPCYLPFRSVYLTYDGKVTLCCRDYDGELVVGDLDKQSLKEIWKGAEAGQVRAKHAGSVPMDIRQCSACHGPYPSVSALVNAYIHALYRKQPQLDARAFGEGVMGVLNRLNDAIGSGDRSRVVARLDEILREMA